MDFGVMFFSSSGAGEMANKYDLLLDAASFADRNGFCSVWTPERHFHEFGGLYPNPSVLSAALAMITRNVQIRAGSLISPLHDPVRIAEEWAVVDNLSGGRTAISFGSGWNVDDFIFFPDRYLRRQATMYEQIGVIQALWQGERITRANSFGKEISIELFPKPVQPSLPVWITSSGNVETFVSAGAIGANLLTHLIGQDLPALAEKIERYREARGDNGFDPAAGKVALMLHTFIGSDIVEVKETVRAPFCQYIKSAISLEAKAASGGGVISGGHKIEPHQIPTNTMNDLFDLTFDRYFRTAALMGTPETCREFVWDLAEIGVDEIACLIEPTR